MSQTDFFVSIRVFSDADARHPPGVYIRCRHAALHRPNQRSEPPTSPASLWVYSAPVGPAEAADAAKLPDFYLEGSVQGFCKGFPGLDHSAFVKGAHKILF